jgi:hypothetical protein
VEALVVVQVPVEIALGLTHGLVGAAIESVASIIAACNYAWLVKNDDDKW